MADPVQIPELTAQIVDNIEILHQKPEETSVRTFRRCFLALPPELRDQILAYLRSSEGLPTDCNGLLPQDVWKELLLGGRFLPFLWDVDGNDVERQVGDKTRQGVELNWELLVRKLSQGLQCVGTSETNRNVLCYPELRIPGGLRNRRRIWQLVEEMYVGDVLPVNRSWAGSAHIPTMPRYWDEYGEPVYPVLRVGNDR